MKKLAIPFSLALFALASGIAWGQAAKDPVAEKYSASLNKIFDLQARFAPLHPVLGKVYPVAIVENKTFYIFEPVPTEKAYRLELGTGWYVPAGILHAPGSLCTYEPQWASDVFAMFQSLVNEVPIHDIYIEAEPIEDIIKTIYSGSVKL